VRAALQLREQRQLGEIRVFDATDLEHVERTHLDAIGFPFAASAIDGRSQYARLRLALLSGALWVSGCTPCFLR